ncbi:slipin family protein [Haloechinothrix sp. LS1_15]|uniref:slipin family protein n=1 Tax=Haloechinothrix sp. LS1_15 TaxID=2652248 RepID=UPI00294744AF|nr:slipin family protein [Haloechinothrix sp. LS1_15]MDV6013889.1 slipin family protein [Haloechinothrix sp. LS1_15]
METVFLTVILVVLGLALVGSSGLRIVRQYERGLVFRFGRVNGTPRQPGLHAIIPGVDHMRKVNMQIVTLPIPGQDGITRDNVTVRVDAVVYFKVIDPVQAVVSVENYRYAVGQVAQTSLRSIIGKSDLDDLLSRREELNQGLELMIDSPAVGWGIHIDRVEIKEVSLPETMKRAMSRQAEAERERRGRVISAEGELQASEKLSQAAAQMADTPGALQLRLLETVVEVAAEKNSTLVLPFPVELLRFLESNTRSDSKAGTALREAVESAQQAAEQLERGESQAAGKGRSLTSSATSGDAEGSSPASGDGPEGRAESASQASTGGEHGEQVEQRA